MRFCVASHLLACLFGGFESFVSRTSARGDECGNLAKKKHGAATLNRRRRRVIDSLHSCSHVTYLCVLQLGFQFYYNKEKGPRKREREMACLTSQTSLRTTGCICTTNTLVFIIGDDSLPQAALYHLKWGFDHRTNEQRCTSMGALIFARRTIPSLMTYLFIHFIVSYLKLTSNQLLDALASFQHFVMKLLLFRLMVYNQCI